MQRAMEVLGAKSVQVDPGFGAALPADHGAVPSQSTPRSPEHVQGQLGQIAGLHEESAQDPRGDGKAPAARSARVTAEGDAGGGMVKVKVNGQMEVIRCEHQRRS